MATCNIYTNRNELPEHIRRYLLDNNGGSFFQNLHLFDLFEGTKNEVVLAVEEENGQPLSALFGILYSDGIFLKRQFSKRLVVIGTRHKASGTKQPTTDNRQLTTSFLSYTRSHAGYLEFRGQPPTARHLFRSLGFRSSNHQTLVLKVESPESAWANLKANRRRQISKSEENGAIIIENPTLEQVMEFYIILKDLYRNKVRKPLPEWQFFRNFHNLISQGFPGKLLCVAHENRIIGGIMLPFESGGCIYEWYVCGLDREYSESGIYPSVMATWAAIKFAAKNGFTEFDLMGIGEPGKPYGVRDFKIRFGGEIVSSKRYWKIGNPVLYYPGLVGYHFLRWVTR